MIPRHRPEVAGVGALSSGVWHPTHGTGCGRPALSTMSSVARRRYEMTDRQHEAGGIMLLALRISFGFGGGMLRKVGFALIALIGVKPSFAQTARVSAPITDVNYEITADSSAVGRRQLGVAMSFIVAGDAPVILALPAWSPGHYTLLWFARRVSQFSAQSNGLLLDWRKLDFQ